MSRLLIGLAACALCFGADTKVVSPKPKTHIRLAGISVGVGYSHFSGPYYGYPYWSGWGPYYSPFWDFYSPWMYPGFYNGFAQGPGMGEVKLKAESASAEVFLDGAYAGTADRLKSMWLEPGAYTLEVKADGRTAFSRRIYVLSGKSLRIDAAAASREEHRP
jgi:hypothetical protein